jgi:hypothetical protein
MSQTEKKDDPLLLGVISKSKAESFLVDLANFDPQGLSDRMVERFFRRWGKLFPGYELETDAGQADLYNFLKLQLREALRTAWNAPTLRDREWYAPQIPRTYNANRVDRSEDGKRLLPLVTQREFHGGGATIVEDLKKLTEHDAAVANCRFGKPPPINACVGAEHFGLFGQVSHPTPTATALFSRYEIRAEVLLRTMRTTSAGSGEA